MPLPYITVLTLLNEAKANLDQIAGVQPAVVTQASSAYSLAKTAIAQAMIQRTANKIELLKYYQSVGIEAPELLAEIEVDLEREHSNGSIQS